MPCPGRVRGEVYIGISKGTGDVRWLCPYFSAVWCTLLGMFSLHSRYTPSYGMCVFRRQQRLLTHLVKSSRVIPVSNFHFFGSGAPDTRDTSLNTILRMRCVTSCVQPGRAARLVKSFALVYGKKPCCFCDEKCNGWGYCIPNMPVSQCSLLVQSVTCRKTLY